MWVLWFLLGMFIARFVIIMLRQREMERRAQWIRQEQERKEQVQQLLKHLLRKQDRDIDPWDGD